MMNEHARLLRDLAENCDLPDEQTDIMFRAADRIESLECQTFPQVNRVEVIDSIGRAFANYGVQPGSCYALLQDDQKTLKVFVTTKDRSAPPGVDDYSFKS